MIKKIMTASALSLAMAACGGGTTDQTTTDITLSGVISAPTGVVAQMEPRTFKSMLAEVMLGKESAAVTTGWSNVGAGIDVNLIEIDASGTQVGSVIASSTTGADGSYSLTLPETFSAGPEYVVRAGSGSTVIDARVTNVGTVNVDPSTDAASDLVTQVANDLGALSIDELQIILELVQQTLADLDASTLDSTTVSDDIITAVQNDPDSSNVINSTTSTGKVCGTVRDSNDTALANITIVARDYGNWVTRSKIKTNSSGAYCLNLPKQGDTNPDGGTFSGDYILGAINHTSTSMAASQWWTSTSASDTAGGGGANNQFEAEKVQVTGTTEVPGNFYLFANGARVEGTVSGHDNGVPEGVTVLLREYDTFKPLSGARVSSDGSYRINVKPGDYMLSYRNSTALPYASEIWRDNNASGVGTSVNARDRNLASRESVSAGTTYTYDVTLEAGELIQGTIYTNSSASTTVSGSIVRIDFPNGSGVINTSEIVARAGRAETLRSDKAGRFRLWVYPSNYNVMAYGQVKAADLTAVGVSSINLAFADDVATINGTVFAEDGSTPVAGAVMFLKGPNGSGTYEFLPSNEDGTFTLHTTVSQNHVLSARLDHDPNYGSAVYDDVSKDYLSGVNWTSGNAQLALTVNNTYNFTGSLPTLGTSGVGYLDGTTVGGGRVNIRLGGGNVVVMRARGDGSFKLSLPVDANYQIIARDTDDSTILANCSGISIANAATTTIDVSGGVCP
ncbi:MAG: hypothetical protein HUJ29_02555 [Gammaproteobacteria bacterium]|nr:hypothetical protein [Gammaproteobacteria bacterium]